LLPLMRAAQRPSGFAPTRWCQRLLSLRSKPLKGCSFADHPSAPDARGSAPLGLRRDTLVSEALVAPLQTATGLLLRLSSFCSWRCRLSALVGLATFDVMGSATCYREGFSFL